jgi:hypothetical protein
MAARKTIDLKRLSGSLARWLTGTPANQSNLCNNASLYSIRVDLKCHCERFPAPALPQAREAIF